MGTIIHIFADYWPHHFQHFVHTCGKRFVNILAGRRGGKTACGAREFVRRVVKQYKQIQHLPYHPSPHRAGTLKVKPRLHYWAIAPDYSLSLVQQREASEALPDSMKLPDGWRETTKQLWLKGNVLIEFKSAQNPDKLVAVGLDGIWIDEVARLKRTAWNANLRPCLSDKMGWAIFSTTPLGKNWWFREIYLLGDPTSELHDPEYINITWKSKDNIRSPSLLVDVDKAKKTMPLKYFMREYEASLEIFAGQIYDNWNPYIHKIGPENQLGISRPPKKFDKFICGVDWGWGDGHPGCMVLFGIKETKLVDGSGNPIPKFWALREIYEERVHIVSPDPQADTWVSRAKRLDAYCYEKYGKHIESFYCDPSEPAYIDYFLDADLPAEAANNAVMPGIQTVSTLMQPHGDTGSPWIYYIEDSDDEYDGCENLVEQKGSYRFKEGTEEPLKENDHAVDAERYAIHSYVEEYGIEIRIIDIPLKQAA